MSVRVGPKGQVVIEKKIRDALGVTPGAVAVQRLVGDRVEIRFLPPQHERSVRGRLKSKTRRRVPASRWRAAVEEAWEKAARDEEVGGHEG